MPAEGRPRRPLIHPLAGARPAGLAHILARHGGVSPGAYPQAAILVASALLRWPGCAVEAVRVAHRLRAVSFDPAPVFIVGHWRSGTTLLHNLMSRDPRFCFPTIVDALRPYDFYPNPAEFITRRVLLRSLPKTRPMDDVPLAPDLPQEEELAMATMGAPSFFNCLYFPRHMTRVFCEQVLFDGATEATRKLWRDALFYYLAKLQSLNPGRRLLLKNPAHSARIPQLRAMFPGAKFIHVHRHPASVFQSTRKLYKTMLPLVALQDYEPAAIDEHILSTYPRLMNRLLDCLAELPPGDGAAVAYADLVAEPVGAVRRVYDDLRLGDPGPAAASAIAAFAESQQRRTPPAGELEPAARSRLAVRWAAPTARLGYPPL